MSKEIVHIKNWGMINNVLRGQVDGFSVLSAPIIAASTGEAQPRAIPEMAKLEIGDLVETYDTIYVLD